jgi:hypothetical protein
MKLNNIDSDNIEERIVSMLEEVLKDDSDSDIEVKKKATISSKLLGQVDRPPVILLNDVVMRNAEQDKLVQGESGMGNKMLLRLSPQIGPTNIPRLTDKSPRNQMLGINKYLVSDLLATSNNLDLNAQK